MLISLPGSMKTMIYPSEALLHCVSATVVHLHRCLGFATSFVFAATFLTFICCVFFLCVCVCVVFCVSVCVCVYTVFFHSALCVQKRCVEASEIVASGGERNGRGRPVLKISYTSNTQAIDVRRW